MAKVLRFGVRIFLTSLENQGGAIHSTKIPTGPTGKKGPPQKVDPFSRNFFGPKFPKILVE